MAHITLTQGKAAVVDDSDYPYLAQFKWYAQRDGKRWYAVRGVWTGGKVTKVWMHRFIFGAASGDLVDHANGDGLDNRRENLRLCSPTENGAHRGPAPGRKYKGVRELPSGQFGAGISSEGRHYDLGRYDDPETAAVAYNQAAVVLHGRFAHLNVVTIEVAPPLRFAECPCCGGLLILRCYRKVGCSLRCTRELKGVGGGRMRRDEQPESRRRRRPARDVKRSAPKSRPATAARRSTPHPRAPKSTPPRQAG